MHAHSQRPMHVYTGLYKIIEIPYRKWPQGQGNWSIIRWFAWYIPQFSKQQGTVVITQYVPVFGPLNLKLKLTVEEIIVANTDTTISV